VSATVLDAPLVATRTLADFGTEGGTRQVDIRVVDELRLELRIEAERLVVLTDEPIVCLVGPFHHALDSSRSDRCWGDPDLSAVLGSELLGNSEGRPVLSDKQMIVIEVTLARGDARCDYAPGEWHLEIAANPWIEHAAAGAREIANLVLDVPLEGAGLLDRLPADQARMCSDPASVYTSQGEPPA
jgi:hypothetical protein